MSNSLSKQTLMEQRFNIQHGNAICYSGYRDGQSPREKNFPSYEEIKEDLSLLDKNWAYIRLYDCSKHAEITLKVIQDEGFDLKVMLGVDMAAELSNPNCPWGADFSDETLIANRQDNNEHVDRLITLANLYPEIVCAVSVGNEASVEWTDHLVSVESLVAYTRRIKNGVSQPVTFCENYVPWTTKLEPLVAELDFISIHTYPVWEYRSITDALEYSKQNYNSVAQRYPDKPVIITEAGWTTTSNGRGIEPENASERLQARYYQELMEWTREEKVLTFVFEAFDEPWKGSADPREPEKHWGVFFEDRSPKQVMKPIFG